MAKRTNVVGGQSYDLKIEYCEHWYKSAFRLFGAPANASQFDRPHLDLPGLQEELIKAVHAAYPNTIAVFQNGSSLSIPWLKDNIPSLLVAWYSGEESGNAIADVLFGDYKPGGRLPLTFYKSVEQLPPFRDGDGGSIFERY
jgi:glycosyl hydrolase family 3